MLSHVQPNQRKIVSKLSIIKMILNIMQKFLGNNHITMNKVTLFEPTSVVVHCNVIITERFLHNLSIDRRSQKSIDIKHSQLMQILTTFRNLIMSREVKVKE